LEVVEKVIDCNIRHLLIIQSASFKGILEAYKIC
jgi:hypothetical protein